MWEETMLNGIQIVLQRWNKNEYICEAYKGLPILNPSQIVIEPINPSNSSIIKTCNQLHAALSKTLCLTSSTVAQNIPPCGGRGMAVGCNAQREPDCIKLLILIGDHSTPLALNQTKRTWIDRSKSDSSYKILPILPSGASITAILTHGLDKLNVATWYQSIEEIIPYILAIAGLTPEDFRIFVSYKRSDSSELAEQLFEALSKKNFDVFEDRFRVPPGVDFQMRLTEELGKTIQSGLLRAIQM
ncbi:TIR-like domain-containing protein [Candidatus Magnetoovum chiemensis]|nr:TIR-like domain-containing protein [Candidatus Magnetoovum chiemensis]